MISLAVNQTNAMSVRIINPAVGPWIVLADLDLKSSSPLPKGPAIVKIAKETLRGTVDETGTGRFGEKARVRIVAGADGWSKDAPRQDFINDAGVKSNVVITATAGSVGESAVDEAPVDLGTNHYVRTEARASRVLDGRIWYVDALGVTHIVKARTSRKPSKDVEILSYDPDQRIARLSADSIVWPGTILTDPRFDETIIRDVEQTFDENGARVVAYCASTEGTRLVTALTTMVEEFGRLATLRVYQYRIVQQNVDGRLYLQAVRKAAGVPDLLPVTIFPGMAGDSADHTPGTLCLVTFLEGDYTRPIVFAFDGSNPLTRSVFATVMVKLGGPGGQPVALAPAVLVGFAAVATWVAALQVQFGINDPATYGANMSGPTSVLAASIAALVATVPALKVQAF